MSVQTDERRGSVAGMESFRGELTGYCYRMLGSPFDADDAVQETLVRAWQAAEAFEGRSSLRSWLYRIATNVCLDSLRGRTRRALPMDLASPGSPATPPTEGLPEPAWVQPARDSDLGLGDPADHAVRQESVRLAFVAALQHLPPRQRSVLVLREVLSWPAAEVASLLDTSVPSVNSALQRARATLAAVAPRPGLTRAALGPQERALLERYVSAFEDYDVDRLVALLHEDASIAMPPLSLWLRGRADLRAWYLGFGAGCRGSRLLPVEVNGQPAFAQYRADEGGGHEPWSVHVVDVADGRVAHVHHALVHPGLVPDVEPGALFARLGLPSRLP